MTPQQLSNYIFGLEYPLVWQESILIKALDFMLLRIVKSLLVDPDSSLHFAMRLSPVKLV